VCVFSVHVLATRLPQQAVLILYPVFMVHCRCFAECRRLSRDSWVCPIWCERLELQWHHAAVNLLSNMHHSRHRRTSYVWLQRQVDCERWTLCARALE
jgi:hypothetical protein